MDSLEYIDNYFKGALLPEQARQIEQRIEEDPAFAEEVAFYLSALQAAKDQLAKDKKEQFRKLYQESTESRRPAPVVKRMWVNYLAAAAVITAFMIGGYLYLQPSNSPQRMADQYEAQHLQKLGMSMGTAADSLETGKNLYNNGKLTEALRYFEPVAIAHKADYSGKELAGLTYYRLGQYDKAIQYFKQVEGYTLYSNNSYFYHALALIKRNKPGDISGAKQLLQQVVDNNYGEKEAARALLERM